MSVKRLDEARVCPAVQAERTCEPRHTHRLQQVTQPGESSLTLKQPVGFNPEVCSERGCRTTRFFRDGSRGVTRPLLGWFTQNKD